MISRLLAFITCPECGSSDLKLKDIKKGEDVSFPQQRGYDLKLYLKYRDHLNSKLLLEWHPDNVWIVWPDNPEYIVNTGSFSSLKGQITSARSGYYLLHLRGILQSRTKIFINGKKIGIFQEKNNGLLDNVYLGKHFLKKGINTIKLQILGHGVTNYIHRDQIFIDQKLFQTISPVTPSSLKYHEIIEGLIVCRSCKHSYPIVDGVPILLKENLMKTYTESGKIPKHLIKTPPHSSRSESRGKGNVYKVSEISIDKTENLPSGFFESMVNHPFFQQDSQRSQEKLLSFSLLTFLLNPKPNEIIFDSAAGPGWTSFFLARLGCEVISADINLDYVKAGKINSQHTYYHRMVCDSENIPVRKNSVDSVFSYDSFHHIPNKPLCLKNFFEILKYGGRAVFYEPKAIHNSNYFSQMVMDKYSILEEGFTPEDFSQYLSGLKFKEPIFHQSPYFKDGNIITVDKIGFRNITSITPGILNAQYTVKEIIRNKSSLSIHLDIKNIGNTIWLASNSLETPGHVYLILNCYNKDGQIINRKTFPLSSCVLPSIQISQSIEVKDINFQEINRLEIDLQVFGLIQFKNAHACNSLSIDLATNENIS